MGIVFMLVFVLAAMILLLFLDIIIEFLYPKGALAAVEDDCHKVLDDGDCFRIPNRG